MRLVMKHDILNVTIRIINRSCLIWYKKSIVVIMNLKSATNNLSSRDSHYGVLYGLTN